MMVVSIFLIKKYQKQTPKSWQVFINWSIIETSKTYVYDLLSKVKQQSTAEIEATCKKTGLSHDTKPVVAIAKLVPTSKTRT